MVGLLNTLTNKSIIMIRYGNKMIANVGHYLVGSNGKRGFALSCEEKVTFEERELLTFVEKRPCDSVTIGGVFNIKVNDHMKKSFISKLWSNDDQIAIILNHGNSEYDNAVFDLMQRWRDWISVIIKKTKELYSD